MSPTTPNEGPSGRKVVTLLAHPLTILLMTALVSGLLVPRLTQQWQDHQQQLTTRRDFAARVSRTVGEIFIATQLAEVGAPSQTAEDFDDAYVQWEIESAVLGAELHAYYRADSLHQAWHRCSELATAYYTQSGISDPRSRIRYLTEIRDELALPQDVDLTDTGVLRAQVLSARDEVIREVLARQME